MCWHRRSFPGGYVRWTGRLVVFGLVGLVEGRIGQTQDAGPNLNTPGKEFNYDGNPLGLLSLVTLYLSRQKPGLYETDSWYLD